MRIQLFAYLLIVGCSLIGGKAEALPKDWYITHTSTSATVHNHHREPVWRGYIDDEGNWNEETLGSKSSGGNKGYTLGDIKNLADHVVVGIKQHVTSVVVIDASRQKIVFEASGDLEAGTTVKIPADNLSDSVQVLVSLDDKGAALDVVFFKRMGACGNKSFWVSR